jgi:hypothetical protein
MLRSRMHQATVESVTLGLEEDEDGAHEKRRFPSRERQATVAIAAAGQHDRVRQRCD